MTLKARIMRCIDVKGSRLARSGAAARTAKTIKEADVL